MSELTPDDLADIERWHFAVGELDTQQETLEIGGPISLRRLRVFPTHEQLALSLTSLPVAGAMAMYGEKVVRHELVIELTACVRCLSKRWYSRRLEEDSGDEVS